MSLFPTPLPPLSAPAHLPPYSSNLLRLLLPQTSKFVVSFAWDPLLPLPLDFYMAPTSPSSGLYSYVTQSG